MDENMEAGPSLPNEILEKIFGFGCLTHTQKLISRLVCKDWNTVISSGLSKTSRYVLLCEESNNILVKSIVQWTSIRTSDYESSALLTRDFRNQITALQLDLSGLPEHSTTTWKILLIEFPNVTTLHINIDDDLAEQQEQPLAPGLTKIEETQWQEVLRKLENLSVTFPFNYYTTLKNIMYPLYTMKWGKEGSLKKLVIRESWSPKPKKFSPPEAVYDPLIIFYVRHVINSSRHTLRYLELDFSSKQIRGRVIPLLLPELCTMEGLKLESLLIHHEPIPQYVERDFILLHEFVKTQASAGVLKDIILPWSSNASLCQELVGSLPRDIESVGNVRREHINQEFPFQFKKLKWLSIGGLIEDEKICNQQCNSVQELQANLRKYGFGFESQGESRLTQVMTKAFPNLTTLKVIGNEGTSFVDQSLQSIIREMKGIRVLHLESCGITDFGVTGADEINIRELVSTRNKKKISVNLIEHTSRKFYIFTLPLSTEEQDEFNSSYLTPLSSLKNLEKLVLVGTKLTDAGIVLGLQFGSKMKQLTLGSESDEVSDLGLHCLGASCHGLEAFQGLFKSPKISEAGIEDFKEQLPLIHSTQQFKVINVKPS